MSNTSRETLRAYVYVCAGCNLLDDAERRDQLTCSGRCRVRAHRNGNLRRLRDEAKRWRITPASILHAAAIDRLDPIVSDRIRSGEVTIDEAQRLVRPAFSAILAALRAGAA